MNSLFIGLQPYASDGWECKKVKNQSIIPLCFMFLQISFMFSGPYALPCKLYQICHSSEYGHSFLILGLQFSWSNCFSVKNDKSNTMFLEHTAFYLFIIFVGLRGKCIMFIFCCFLMFLTCVMLSCNCCFPAFNFFFSLIFRNDGWGFAILLFGSWHFKISV